MFRPSRWLCQVNVFVLIFDLVQHVVPLFCSGKVAQLFPAAWQAVRASVQSIFLRCLWSRCKVHRENESRGKFYNTVFSLADNDLDQFKIFAPVKHSLP